MTTLDALEIVRNGVKPLEVLVDCCSCHYKYRIYEAGQFDCPACGSRSGIAMARELPGGWRAFNRDSYQPL